MSFVAYRGRYFRGYCIFSIDLYRNRPTVECHVDQVHLQLRLVVAATHECDTFHFSISAPPPQFPTFPVTNNKPSI